MFKPIVNPYIVGNPIRTPDMFYGRQDDFDFIKRKLETGDKSYVFVLCGERRSGKTSILFQILRGRLGSDFIPVLIDMQSMAGLKNEREFFEKFAFETQKYLKTRIDTDKYFKTSDSSFKAFSNFLNDVYTSNPGKHILFLIDEYELIESKVNEGSLTENFIPYLAGLLESEMMISFIFTGSTILEDRENKIWQILFAKSLFRNVSYLSRDDCLRLIKEPVKDRIDFNLEALNMIYMLTAGHPFYTQVVCQNIVDYVNQQQNTQIQEENLEIIVHEILENPLPQMIYFWNSLSNDKKLVFSLLAEFLESSNEWTNAEDIIKKSRQKKFGLNLTEKGINTTLDALYHSQHLSKSQAGYKFQMDIYRRWIKRDHAIWRVMKEVHPAMESETTQPETEDSTSKRSAMPYIIGAVVLIALIAGGWWILQPSGNMESPPVESIVDNSEPENDTENQKTIQDENKEEVNKPVTETKNTTPPAKNTETVVNKKEPQTSFEKSNTEHKSATQHKTATPAVNPNEGKEDADEAKVNSANAKKAALTSNASNLAKSEYTSAVDRENEAQKLYNQKKYPEAEVGFSDAERLFKTALTKSNRLMQLKQQADDARNEMETTKSKLSEKHKKLKNYNSARMSEQKALAYYNDNDFEQAESEYKSATNKYGLLITEYDSDYKNINQVINAYMEGIQNESIAQMKQVYPKMTSDFEDGWKQVFEVASDLKIVKTVRSIDSDGTSAIAEAAVKLTFKGTPNAKTNNWQFGLTKSDSNWFISNVSEGN